MRKIMAIIAGLLVLAALCGCSAEPTQTTAATTMPEDTAVKELTISQLNALESAKTYVQIAAYSYEGLITQLEEACYTHEDAVYAADNCGADWDAQAVRAAKEYAGTLIYDNSRLAERLIQDGFTQEQAERAVDTVS